jgi:hypothetical protein
MLDKNRSSYAQALPDKGGPFIVCAKIHGTGEIVRKDQANECRFAYSPLLLALPLNNMALQSMDYMKNIIFLKLAFGTRFWLFKAYEKTTSNKKIMIFFIFEKVCPMRFTIFFC